MFVDFGKAMCSTEMCCFRSKEVVVRLRNFTNCRRVHKKDCREFSRVNVGSVSSNLEREVSEKKDATEEI